MDFIFNNKNMCKFFHNFNPVSFKYGISVDEPLYVTAKEYDEKHKILNLEKHDYSDIIYNTTLTYGDLSKSFEYVSLFKKVLQKFIIEFLGIPGLGSIYNEHYLEFEWNMHSNLNFTDHTNSYYRDHFVHEMRNLYMAFEFLSDVRIYNNIKESILHPTLSKVSSYVTENFHQWRSSVNCSGSIGEILRKINDYEDNESIYSDYFLKYVIHASLTIACLFHDIGYPVSYYMSIKDRIIDFFPSFHALISDSNFDFNYVHGLLNESILFQFVGKDEIKKKYEQNDHGVISAILLGVYFYKNGKIFSLPFEQRVAVELGILAIYNHTLSLSYCPVSSKDKKSEYVKMQFSLNPISYVLRLCDDIQEWDREYFEISHAPNLLFCPKCHTPFFRLPISKKDYYKLNNIVLKDIVSNNENPEGYYKYECMCSKSESIPLITKYDDFHRRKLIDIKACDEVRVIEEDSYVEINFLYSNYKLLRLSSLNLSFTKYRNKQIKSIKKFLHFQNFISVNQRYKPIMVRHNLSPNPFLLKMWIMKEFFESDLFSETSAISVKPYSANNLNKEAEIFKEIKTIYGNLKTKCEGATKRGLGACIKHLAKKLTSMCYEGDYAESFIDNCTFYLSLYAYSLMITFNSEKVDLKSSKKWLNNVFLKTSSAGNKYDKYSFRKQLFDAAVEQIQKSTCINFRKLYSNDYLEYLIEQDDFYDIVAKYCSMKNRINSIENTSLTYYSDLYMYEMLNEYIKIGNSKESLNDIEN